MLVASLDSSTFESRIVAVLRAERKASFNRTVVVPPPIDAVGAADASVGDSESAQTALNIEE